VLKATVTLSAELERGTVQPASDTKRLAKSITGKWLGEHIRKRIQQRGQGAGGQKLAGYSTRPVKVNHGLLRKKEPSGGLPKRYKGGYKEYREDVGLQTDNFAFTNTGYSMSNFGHLNPGGDSIDIGFTDANSDQAAQDAVDRGREQMFDVDDKELDRVTEIYLNSVVAGLWTNFFSAEASTITEEVI
jgi:hypothetical protein